MTPAQRLAEWLDAHPTGYVDLGFVCGRPVTGAETGWDCGLFKDGRFVRRFRAVSRDAAITAALDAWEKGQ